MEYLRLEQVSVWDAGLAGGGPIKHATTLVPETFFLRERARQPTEAKANPTWV